MCKKKKLEGFNKWRGIKKDGKSIVEPYIKWEDYEGKSR